MPEPRIVSPQEAQDWIIIGDGERLPARRLSDLVSTVATEPDRIAAAERASVVKALRDAAVVFERDGAAHPARVLRARADAIENGADYA